MKRLLILFFEIFSIATILAGCSPNPSTNQDLSFEEDSAMSESPPAPEIKATHTTETSPEASANRLSESIGGLTVEIREYDLNPDNPTITICADLPSVADWQPMFSASHKDEPVYVWMVILIDPQHTAEKEKNRCYLAKLSNDTGAFDEDQSGRLVFSLDHFQMSLPEQLPEILVTQANQITREAGIEFEVQNAPHTQNYVITKKPDSISEQEALQAVQEAIDEAAGIVHGPWVFMIDMGLE